MKKLSRHVYLVLLIPALLFLFSCKPRVYKKSGLLKTIPLNIIVVSNSEPKWDDIFKFVNEKTVLMDHRNPLSPLWKLNKNGNAAVSDELLKVIEESVKVARESGGAFDPSIFPLTKLWGFDHGGRLPSKEDIKKAKSLVNYRLIKIKPDGTVAIPNGMGLDLGGIAKGAIVDELADYLNTKGYSQFLIDAGGDILMQGLKINAKWKIGIKHPRKDNSYITVVSLGRRNTVDKRGRLSIVSSGDYEQYFIKGGVRYNHIINPETGYPANGAVSVTVISSSCTEADAYSTAAFVLGYKRGLAFLKNLPAAAGLIIREEEGRLQAEETDNFPVPLDKLKL